MSKETKPNFTGFADAPFIYFDVAPTFGTMDGTVQIELTSRVLVPGGTEPTVEFVCTGHLRCSPAAAVELRKAIDGVLQLLQHAAEGQSVAPKAMN